MSNENQSFSVTVKPIGEKDSTNYNPFGKLILTINLDMFTNTNQITEILDVNCNNEKYDIIDILFKQEDEKNIFNYQEICEKIADILSSTKNSFNNIKIVGNVIREYVSLKTIIESIITMPEYKNTNVKNIFLETNIAFNKIGANELITL